MSPQLKLSSKVGNNGEVMAFSAQPDHGQNDRTHRDLSGIVKVSRRERTKFVPNPAAKPFVPSSNLDNLTRSNKTWSTVHRGHSSLSQFESCNRGCTDGKNLPNTISHKRQHYKKGSLPNGILGHNILHSCAVNNGVQLEKPLHSNLSQPGKHIALHLVSKVLDDETIFNFNSIDESTNLPEPFSSSPGHAHYGQGFGGTAHSWPLSSTNNNSHTAPSISIPGIAPNIGSLSGQNIWSHEAHQVVTPPLSPLDSSPPSCNELSANESFIHHRPVRPSSLSEQERFSPLVNGFTDDQSPYPSPTGQSYSSSNASPRQSFLPIQESYCNGRSQQSCESGYVSNSNYGTQMSPSSLHGFVPSSPELHGFILPLSTTGSQYNSSPSLSPSSPPLGQMKLDLKHLSSDNDQMINSTKLKQHCFREKSYHLQSPSKERKENGYVSFSPLQKTKSPFTSELHLRLDECYEQLRCLEKERKKAEAEISHLWSSRKLSGSGNCVSLRLPPNSSRIDKMVIDQLREHAKVETLVSRIERIRHSPLHLSISECVDQWQEAVKDLQAKRKEEISSFGGGVAGRSRLCSSRFHDGSDLQGLISAVKELCVQTRAIRTTVWCAVHLVTCESIPRASSFESESSTSTTEMNVLEGTGEVS